MSLEGGAVITAGGKGARIGYDKKRITLGGRALIERQIELLSSLFDEVLVSSNTPFSHKNTVTVRDTLGAGPLAGIYSALNGCKSGRLFACACDMPCIPPEYIIFLDTWAKNKPFDLCAVRRDDGFIEPFNAFYRKSALPALAEALAAGIYKAQGAFRRMRILALPASEAARFTVNGHDIFYNINYEKDLRALGEASAPCPGPL